MYWLITFNDGSQKAIKANDVMQLGEKVDLTKVLNIMKLSDDIFENLAEAT